jgi:hypothetical protein
VLALAAQAQVVLAQAALALAQAVLALAAQALAVLAQAVLALAVTAEAVRAQAGTAEAVTAGAGQGNRPPSHGEADSPVVVDASSDGKHLALSVINDEEPIAPISASRFSKRTPESSNWHLQPTQAPVLRRVSRSLNNR